MLYADGKICPNCGQDCTAGKDQAIVYLQCPVCETVWFDQEADRRNHISRQDFPDFRAEPGCCPSCGWEGELYFWIYLDRGVLVVECDECNLIWLDPRKTVLKYSVSVSSKDLKGSFWALIQCSILNRRWATRGEVIAQGFENCIQEKAATEVKLANDPFGWSDSCKSSHDCTVQDAVREAIRVYDIDGLEATVAYFSLDELSDTTSYLFIVDRNGLTIASPFSEMIGRDPALRVDSEGCFFGDELLRATEEGKWLSYFFHNPRTGRQSRKRTWVARHEGLFFASGYYPDDGGIFMRWPASPR